VAQTQGVGEHEALWTVEQLATALDVPVSWAYNNREIPRVKLGKYVRFRPSAVRAFLEARESQAGALLG
jgi:hypothetical protein